MLQFATVGFFAHCTMPGVSQYGKVEGTLIAGRIDLRQTFVGPKGKVMTHGTRTGGLGAAQA